jgi:hypothetical protein
MDDFEKMLQGAPMELSSGKLFLHLIYSSVETSNYLKSILKAQLEIKHLLETGNYDKDKVGDALEYKMHLLSEQISKQYSELVATFIK